MWNTVGHTQQKQILDQALQSGKVPHAYLFCGPSSIGKKTLALEFARKILGLENGSGFNPDLILIEDSALKVEAARNLIKDLSLKPYSLSHKVAVIDNFENATDEAANSILKTLEEPAPQTIIFLICSNKNSVLPTITSRCQIMHFSPVNESGESVDTKLLHDLRGRIGRAIQYQNDPEFKKNFDEDIVAWNQIKKNNRLGRMALIKQMADVETPEFVQKLERWLDASESDLQDLSNYKRTQSILEAIDSAKKNFNKKLILEKLFLSIE